MQALRPGQDHASLTALLKDLHLRAAGMTKHTEAAGTTKRRPLHVVIDVRHQPAAFVLPRACPCACRSHVAIASRLPPLLMVPRTCSAKLCVALELCLCLYLDLAHVSTVSRPEHVNS